MVEQSHISLSQLATQVNDALAVRELNDRWVVAEIANINVNRISGHCYFELVEKSPITSQVVATIKATIWASKYKLIASYFNVETGCELAVGMKIMFCCSVSFHPVYSLSINITDIDPTYTIGQAQRQRMITIEALKNDGIFEMNKELEMPFVPQKIAVVSSATAAGFEDFQHQLDSSDFNFTVTLFQAMMQGKETQSSVCEALAAIANSEEMFDIVVVIRGGGAATDLQWFDSYQICSYIAQMPLPCVTGIGHTKDMSIADMVAHTSLKTPTAVADFIVERVENFIQRVYLAHEQIYYQTDKIIKNQNTFLDNVSMKIASMANQSLNIQRSLIGKIEATIKGDVNLVINKYCNKNEALQVKIQTSVCNAMSLNDSRLKHFAQMIDSHKPENVLKRGYALIKKEGKIISDPSQIAVSDLISISIKDKTIVSNVIKIS